MPAVINKTVSAFNGIITISLNTTVTTLKDSIPITVNTTVASLKDWIPGAVNTTVSLHNENITSSVNTTVAALWRTEAYGQQDIQPSPYLIEPLSSNCSSCSSESVTFDYSYVVYCLLILLFVAALACIKVGMQRRNIRRAEAQTRAAQRNIRAHIDQPNNNNGNSNNNSHNISKDLPPAYDDIIPPRFMEKQSLPNSVNSAHFYGISAITPAVTDQLPAGRSTLSTGISNDIDIDIKCVANTSVL